MFKNLILFTLFFLLLKVSLAQQVASRIPGSPYPVSGTPSKLYVTNDWGWGSEKQFTTLTLQGLLAKAGNTMIYNESGVGYSVWVEDLVANYGVTVDKIYYNNFKGLITHFQNSFDGYILCNIKDNSSNVAVSLCAQLNAIAVTPENESLMVSLGKQKLMDVRGKDEEWALESDYASKFSKDIVSFQREDKCAFLSDYSIFADAFQFFDTDINSELVNDAFERMNSNRVVMGWGPDEENTVKKISQNSLQLNGTDWTENLPVLSNFEAELKQKTHAATVNDEDNVHTVCFLVSDGDNFDWLLKEFYGHPKAYGSPNRGQVSIGWSISPALSELGPTIMNYLYDNASNTSSAKDFFIGSTSGIGYMNPDYFPHLQESADLTNKFMKKADLNILNIIGKNYRTSDMQKFLSQDNIDAIFYYKYDNYAGLNGNIYIVNDKPVIGARYRLWEGFDNAETLAAKLNNQSTDAYSADGYSLIAVHAWSFNQYVVDEINACASRLNSNVIVLPPDEFVMRIKKKFGLPTAVNTDVFTEGFKVYPNPVCSDFMNFKGDFRRDDVIEIVDVNNRLILRSIIKNEHINTLRIDLKNSISNGLYIVRIVRDSKVYTTKVTVQR